MRASFVEVHDDNVHDLLADPGSSSDVVIREDGRGEVVLVGATEAEAKVWCTSVTEVVLALKALQREFDFEDKRVSA